MSASIKGCVVTFDKDYSPEFAEQIMVAFRQFRGVASARAFVYVAEEEARDLCDKLDTLLGDRQPVKPEPEMTIGRACEVLACHEYAYCPHWRTKADTQQVEGVTRSFAGPRFTRFEAIAIAEKIERDAARQSDPVTAKPVEPPKVVSLTPLPPYGEIDLEVIRETVMEVRRHCVTEDHVRPGSELAATLGNCDRFLEVCAQEIERLRGLLGIGLKEVRDAGLATAKAYEDMAATNGLSYQERVKTWTTGCFGETIAADKTERNHRFIEEALELVQSLGATRSDCHRLIDYVYGRPAGNPYQEVGGVMVTLAALCNANGIDLEDAGDDELARAWTKIDVIRAKQAAKPKGSPLPEAEPPTPDSALIRAVRYLLSVRLDALRGLSATAAIERVERLIADLG